MRAGAGKREPGRSQSTVRSFFPQGLERQSFLLERWNQRVQAQVDDETLPELLFGGLGSQVKTSSWIFLEAGQLEIPRQEVGLESEESRLTNLPRTFLEASEIL